MFICFLEIIKASFNDFSFEFSITTSETIIETSAEFPPAFNLYNTSNL